MKTKVCITLNPFTLRTYKEYCKKEGIAFCRRIEILMQKDLEELK